MQRLQRLTVSLTLAVVLVLAISLAWDVSQGPRLEQTSYLAALGAAYIYLLGAFCLYMMVGFGLQFWVLRSTGPHVRRLGILCLVTFVPGMSALLCIFFALNALTLFRVTAPISLSVPNARIVVTAAPIANGASIGAALVFLCLSLTALITRLRRRSATS